MFAGSSSCVTFDHVEVDERPDVVRVDAYVRADDGQPCTDDFVVEPVTVTLDAPLGERALEGCADEGLGFAAFGREGPIDCAEPAEGW